MILSFSPKNTNEFQASTQRSVIFLTAGKITPIKSFQDYYFYPKIMQIKILCFKCTECTILLLIIITAFLFQEVNVFGTNASQGPQLQKDTSMIIESVKHLQYVQSRCCLRTPSIPQAGYPTLLSWRWRYDLSRLKTSRFPHVVREKYLCLLTRSMFINMYESEIAYDILQSI